MTGLQHNSCMLPKTTYLILLSVDGKMVRWTQSIVQTYLIPGQLLLISLTPCNLFCWRLPWVSVLADALDSLICFLPNRVPGKPPFAQAPKFPLISSLSTPPAEYYTCWVGWFPHPHPDPGNWSLYLTEQRLNPEKAAFSNLRVLQTSPQMKSWTSHASSHAQETVQNRLHSLHHLGFQRRMSPQQKRQGQTLEKCFVLPLVNFGDG